MKSPPIQSRELVVDDFKWAACQLLKKDPTERDAAQVLRPGHLTALTGSLLHRRKRYASGLACLHPRMSSGPIVWFSRYWIITEIAKALLSFELNFYEDIPEESESERMVRAIEAVKRLNVYFESSHRSMTEVCGHIECLSEEQVPRLVIVDSIEHFRASPEAYRPVKAMSDALELLKDCAKRHKLAVLVTCLPPPSDWSDAVVAAANEVITISERPEAHLNCE